MEEPSSAMETDFAPAERLGIEEINRQRGLFEHDRLAVNLLSAVPDIFLILNQQRQIVYANEAVIDMFGLGDRMCVYGKRPGELLNCVHSCEKPGGCGTTEACSLCGAVQAILNGLDGEHAVSECRVLRNDGVDAIDLRVYASPFDIEDKRFCLFALVNISDEKRRRILERIFFHDVLNTAGGLIGFTELLKGASEEDLESFSGMVNDLARRLVDEIRGQQQLSAAETGDLSAAAQVVTTGDILDSLGATFRFHEASTGKSCAVSPTASKVSMVTDPVLMGRVLVNLTKNAFEASRLGDKVTVDCQADASTVTFSVHNRTFMPREVQLQMFQRSFSTKGRNRGLGSYSAKLICERYLQGKVWFESDEEAGTTFYAKIPRELS